MDRLMAVIHRLTGPIENEFDRRRASLMAGLCIITLGSAPIILVGDILLHNPTGIVVNLSITILTLMSIYLLRIRQTRAAEWLFVLSLSVVSNIGAFLGGGIDSGVYGLNAAIVLIAGLVLRARGTIIVIGIALAFAAGSDLSPVWLVLPFEFRFLFWTMILTIIAVIVVGVVQIVESALSRLQQQTRELEHTIQELERTNVSRNYVESILGALREFIVVTKNYRIISVAGAVQPSGGWHPDELIGEPLEQIFRGINKHNPAHSRDVVFLRKDQTEVPVLVTMGRLPNDECVWAASDVSALVATTEALRQSHDRARAANAAKSSFLANMSHELRTPLNAIIGYGELLADDIDDPVMLEDLSRIGSAAHSLLELINGVLDLSKIESGRIELQQEWTEMDDIVQPLIAVMEPIVLQRGLSLQVQGEGIAGPSIYTDPQKLRQILTNLLSNAAKFTNEGGIQLKIQRWERSRMPWVRFEVIDTGIGLSQEDIDVVFEAFTQARERNDAQNPQGTGLGLSICRAYVEMMGGQIFVESTLGEGSRFVVELPAAQYSALTPLTPSAPIPDAIPTAQRILTVDDDTSFLTFARRILERKGRQVICTTDPHQALDWADRFRADLVLLDISMPILSGWSFAVRLKKTLNKDTPVIVVSGAGDEEVATALGCRGFILKPARADELIAAVDDVLASASPTDTQVE